ncbi:MAG: zinc-dependent alcohol dehydrogenase family protein [Steroidobacterales bacterium]
MKRVLAIALALTAAAAFGAAPAIAPIQKQYRLVDPGPSGFTLKLIDAPVRAPGASEVLVRVHATSLNRRDIYVKDGQYPLGSRTSLVPLSDGAGEVVAVGTATKRFKVGDRVAAIFFQNWLGGRPPADPAMNAIGGALDGMLSEYVTLNENGLVRIPSNLSYEEAATLPCAGVTAWNALVTRGHTKAGDYVLLEGTGGVSTFGLQFAVALGAKPIITSSSDAKLERAKALGAIGTINYKQTPDWEKAVRELTGGAGAQQILDVGGKDTLPHAIASLGASGNLSLIGGLGGFGGEIPALALLGNNASAHGIYVGSRADFEAMNAFIEKHKLKPVIDKKFEYKDAPAAYDLMKSGDFLGKIVIRVAGN